MKPQQQPYRRTRRRRPSVRVYLGVVLAFAAAFTTATDSFITTPSHHSTNNGRNTNSSSQQRHSPLLPLHVSTAIPLPLHTNHKTHRNNSLLPPPTHRKSGTRFPKPAAWLVSVSSPPTTTSNTNAKKQTATTTSTATAATDGWAERYCSVQGLREAFGRNRNVVWGDLDGPTTRRLYKRLLPIILLELRDYGLYDATELAPLAYRARRAAKLYARERSVVPARLAANWIDLCRHFAKYGQLGWTGMSYQQLFEKYAELCQTKDEREVCTKILERSCVSNETIDRLCGIHGRHHTSTNPRRIKLWQELEDVSIQCEVDIKKLLQLSESLQNFRALRSLAKVKRRISSLQKSLTLSNYRSRRRQQQQQQQQQ
jgi:hypothetical protein